MNGQAIEQHSLSIPLGDCRLNGDLSLPGSPQGAVLFAHGSGSSRLSPRNRRVAAALNDAGFATLLFDLLTGEEEAIDARTGQLRFDVELLAGRLLSASDWVRQWAAIADLPLGYFGASTGAAAALIAAARRTDLCAVVSRGGRPDLAGPDLEAVRAPTLLIVGGNDTAVIAMNRDALARLNCEKEMVLVPGATHLFEEQGALERVAVLATDWFHQHLSAPQDAPITRTGGSLA